MPEIIYVLGIDGKPQMPTKRRRHVKRLLDSGKARIATHVPYTIQLLYKNEAVTQPVVLAEDCGRTNIGIAAIDSKGKLLFAARVETRNKEIKNLMADRKAYRQASRRGERKARQRLAKRHDTMLAAGFKMRHLPYYGKDKYVTCKVITNTEARFSNRKRPNGWLTPSANQPVQTHINLVHRIQKFLPVTDVAMEVNRFAFVLLEDPSIKGVDFQNGRLKGFDDVHEAVKIAQKNKCLLCGGTREHDHHIIPRSKGGSDTFDNLAGLCFSCHDMVHKDAELAEKLKTIKAGQLKKYGALSVLNQSIPFIYKGLVKEFGSEHVFPAFGHETAKVRESLGFEKTKTDQMHEVDAYCIALLAVGAVPDEIPVFEDNVYDIKQFRRHDRAVVRAQRERTYKESYMGTDKHGNQKVKWVTVAKNRNSRTGQSDTSLKKKEKTFPSLSDWYAEQIKLYGEAEAQKKRSQLKILKSTRRYNNMDRIMPGAVFRHKGNVYVLNSQQNGGIYLYACGDKETRYRADRCTVLKNNAGLVFV